MAISLVVRRGDGSGADYAYRFEQDEVVAGRGESVDVCLPDAAVSLVHLRLVRQRDELWAIDLGSTNGTVIDGRRIAAGGKQVVTIGAQLAIGPFQVEVVDPGAPHARPPAHDTASFARQMILEALGAQRGERYLLRVIAGPNRDETLELLPDRARFTVGRGEQCDLRLSDADASRLHVELRWESGALMARDPGSKNGFEVNGQRVVSQQPLVHGDELQLGRSRLRLVMAADDVLARLQRLEEASTPDAERSGERDVQHGAEPTGPAAVLPSAAPVDAGAEAEHPAVGPLLVIDRFALLAIALLAATAAGTIIYLLL